MKPPKVVVLVNPWAIGDVVMMLPLAGAIRRHWPEVKLHFAGRQPDLTRACEFFDSVIDSEAIIADPGLLKRLGADVYLNPFSDEGIARAGFAARVPIRVGNFFRRRTIVFCNRYTAYGAVRYGHMLDYSLHHVKVLGVPVHPLPTDHRELFGLTRVPPAPEYLRQQLDPQRFNLILHTKSAGSAHEWPPEHFLQLARLLQGTGAFKLFLTGRDSEREALERECPALLHEGLATDLMGKLTRQELISFINVADGLLAAGTGPLHVAAALGRHALGLFPTKPGLDQVSWHPVGPRARAMSSDYRCAVRSRTCTKLGPPCPCTHALRPEEVLKGLITPALEQWCVERQSAAAAAT